MKTRRVQAACLLAAGALVAAAILPAGPAAAAPGDTGSVTSVTTVPGKAQGTGKWGFVGDIETLEGRTYNYGLAFSPTDDSLWVTDSGKVVYNATLCRLAGYPQTPCQTGTPRVFRYGLTGDEAGAGSEAALTSYVGDGGYSASSVWNNGDSAGRSVGLGGRYVASPDRTTYTYPGPMTQHGPRGIAFTPDGRAFVADSEAVAPLAAKVPGP